MVQNLRDNREKRVPVFLFTGFLGAGKTTFLQDTLSDPDSYQHSETTLLLICEEGEAEYNPIRFPSPDVCIEVIEEEEELTPANLRAIMAKYDNEIDRVFVEYNGMWMIETLYNALPRNWVVFQEMTFMDAEMFQMYNLNMRQLTFDKLKTAEMVIFNRCEKGMDKMPLHKEVRIANRKSQIIYEYGPQDIEIDDIEDPLPFDKTKSSFEIGDEMYAEWYRDINEHEDDYEGKTITVKGRVALAEELPAGKFAFGRHVMTCCVDDIQFAGLMCIYANSDDFKTGDWVEIKAKVRNVYEEAYGEKGPVLYAKTIKRCDPVVPEVATF